MKNKAGLPNLRKWKEFRYKLVKDDIEVDADNEEDLMHNFYENNNKFSYKLKNGKILEVEETEQRGMAGQPMTVVSLKIDGKSVKLERIKNLMNSNDLKELKKYLDKISDSNKKLENYWINENKKSSKQFDIAKWRELYIK